MALVAADVRRLILLLGKTLVRRSTNHDDKMRPIGRGKKFEPPYVGCYQAGWD